LSSFSLSFFNFIRFVITRKNPYTIKNIPTIERKFSGTYENDFENSIRNPKTVINVAIIKPKPKYIQAK
jgi:hypothetical protein